MSDPTNSTIDDNLAQAFKSHLAL